jgi:ATP-dependent Clp protease ATP-binding subunit ClpX
MEKMKLNFIQLSEIKTCFGLNTSQIDIDIALVKEFVTAFLIAPFITLDWGIDMVNKIIKGNVTSDELEKLNLKLYQKQTLLGIPSLSDISISAIKKKIFNYHATFPLSKEEFYELKIYVPFLEIPNMDRNLHLNIVNNLQSKVKGQDGAVRTLSRHLYKWSCYWETECVEQLKPVGNLLITGESGSGKTYMIKTAASSLNAQLVNIDASRLVSEGIVGTHLTNEIIMQTAKLDNSSKKKVVVFIDEFDKLIFKPELLNELLIMMDTKTKTIRGFDSYDHKNANLIELDITSFCFILGGAFTSLRSPKSNDRQTVGFTSTCISSATNHIDIDALTKYGLPKELIGRIGEVINLVPITKDILIDVLLHSSDSPLNYYHSFFQLHKMKLEISDDLLSIIAQKAMDKGIGVRGLFPTLNEIFAAKVDELFTNK